MNVSSPTFVYYINPLSFDMYRYTDISFQTTVLFILIIFFISVSRHLEIVWKLGTAISSFRFLIFWIRLSWLCKN